MARKLLDEVQSVKVLSATEANAQEPSDSVNGVNEWCVHYDPVSE
jgi:hypothetical protein